MSITEAQFASVLIKGVPTPLNYLIPNTQICEVGNEVQITIGKRTVTGWVVDIKPISEAIIHKSKQQKLFDNNHDLKTILSASNGFLKEQLPLFEWISNYYGCELISVIETAIPKRLKTKQRKQKEHKAIFTYEKPARLSTHQVAAIEASIGSVKKAEFQATLLYGVTGSGKTEVYLSAIESCLEEQGAALVIIPEIALSPQFVDRFISRLNIPIAVLHSEVGPSTRWRAWENLMSGKIKVALGARSAVFAPIPNLKLIIVDEEHESSYKQSDGLRYHARDVAVMRAKFSSCPIILGSATPSFESLANVRDKKYKLLELPERATSCPLPQIEIVNLREIRSKDMPSENISPQLKSALANALKNKEQAVILYNRRGFASYVQCDTCQEVLSCPGCSLPLTFHQTRNKLLCHMCDYSQTLPEKCPSCWNKEVVRIEDQNSNHGNLFHRGSGTEKVVDEISLLFPEAKIIRMDRDTVGKKDSYREILSAMKNKHADILVGTQMIAKGHDLPGVTLVGIVDADVGLHMPDFRSSERAYQLITQASGRAGRGDQVGSVILQTREPKHPTIVAAVTGRFKAFARYEIDNRAKLGYPPEGKLLRLIISSPNRTSAIDASTQLKEYLSHPSHGLSVLGPAACFYERIRNRYRWHIILKSASSRDLSLIAKKLSAWKRTIKDKNELRLAIDIDPVDML